MEYLGENGRTETTTNLFYREIELCDAIHRNRFKLLHVNFNTRRNPSLQFLLNYVKIDGKRVILRIFRSEILNFR